MVIVEILGGVAVLLAAGFVYEQIGRRQDRALPLPGKVMAVGGCSLHVTESGQGGPTVVLIHGAGDSSYSWLHVQKEVARFARVVAYDRPGLGSSGPGPGPDAERTVEELRELLGKVGAPGPYILVGHSLGGLIARLYTVRYPEQVAGMVLVDSTHEDLIHDKGFKQGFAAIGAVLKVLKALSSFGLPRFLGQVLKVMFMWMDERASYAAQVSRIEYQSWSSAFYRALAGDGGVKEIAAALPIIEAAGRVRRPFGDLPMAVLTNPGFGENWIAMHRELAGRSTNSVHRISDRKGHSLQMTRPDLVIESISHVAEQVQAKGRVLA